MLMFLIHANHSTVHMIALFEFSFILDVYTQVRQVYTVSRAALFSHTTITDCVLGLFFSSSFVISMHHLESERIWHSLLSSSWLWKFFHVMRRIPSIWPADHFCTAGYYTSIRPSIARNDILSVRRSRRTPSLIFSVFAPFFLLLQQNIHGSNQFLVQFHNFPYCECMRMQ